MSKQITEDSTFAEMEIDDTFPNGDRIISAEKFWSEHFPEELLVKVVVAPDVGSGLVSLGSNWAIETWGEALKRAEFMMGLVDHS